MKEQVRIALPNGELKKDVVTFMQDIGLTIAPTERGLIIPVGNLPIEFVLVRASDVPRMIQEERSTLKAGITGSDILWENGLGMTVGEEVPIYQYNPQAKRSSLYFGVSDSFMRHIAKIEGRSVVPTDVSGKMLATKFVNIASEYCRTMGIENIETLYVPGTDEAMQYVYPECIALIGIRSSGTTIRANNIQVVDEFHTVTLRMIQAKEKLTPRDEAILNEYRELVTTSCMKRQTLSTAYL